jgi:cell division FtsZ-interacting protein ZapD
MNYKIKAINTFNEQINEEITDIFFATKSNSVYFIDHKEATQVRKKLLKIKDENKIKLHTGVEIPNLDPPFNLDTVVLQQEEDFPVDYSTHIYYSRMT